MVVRYSISTQVWTHYSYPSQHLVASEYNDGSSLFMLVGDNAGNVLKIDTGITDNGTPISYSLVHAWDNVNGGESTRKTLNNIMFQHSGAHGSNITYQTEKSITNDWTQPVGQLKERNTGFSGKAMKGTTFRFRISGTSKGEPINYQGYEINLGSSELITFT